MHESKKDLKRIPLAKIKRPDHIDRLEIDPEEIEALAKSIESQGLWQPPILRPKGTEYEIVAGDRRILAIRSLNWDYVDAVVVDLTDEQAAEIRGVENLQRVDLTPIEEAKVYDNLHRVHHKTLAQIARATGKSQGIVKRRLDLLKMPRCLQNAIQKKLISYGVAEALWSIEDEGALEYYLSCAVDHGATVPVARQWAQDWKAQAKAMAEDPEADFTPEPRAEFSNRPTYLACDLCEQPETIQNIVTIRLCRKCAKMIRQAKLSQEE